MASGEKAAADRPARPDQLVRAESIAAGYGAALVIRDVSISAGRGEIVTVVGPNGSGKSTLLKALAGMVAVRAGRIWYDGADVARLPAEVRARRGIAYLPQEREVFGSLTVRENLLMGGYALDRRALKAALERVHRAYPVLARLDRTPAGRLSGGERKTVAMARLMMSSPSVVLLRGPTRASRPPSAAARAGCARAGRRGVAVILVEQRAVQAIAVSDWVCSGKRGRGATGTRGRVRRLPVISVQFSSAGAVTVAPVTRNAGDQEQVTP